MAGSPETPSREVARPRRPARLERPVGAADAAELLGSHEDDVSEGLPARLEERRRARRRLRTSRLVAAISVVAVVAAAAWALLGSPVFRLDARDVRVQGATQALTADQVGAAVAPYVGTPLALLDTDAVAAAVSALPLARDVTVARAWPSGVSVSLSVRTAAMGVAADGGVQLVDDQGVVVGQSDAVPDGLPTAALPAADDPARPSAAALVVAVWAALPEDLRSQTASIASDGAQATLSLAGGQTVRWGTADDSDLKARVLAVLLSQRPATVYDVSAPTRPVVS